MANTYAPRTVALVALVSLVVGFVFVFGGGLLVLRPRARVRPVSVDRTPAGDHATLGFAGDSGSMSSSPSVQAGPDETDAAGPSPTTDSVAAAGSTDSDAGTAVEPATPPPPPPVSAAGVTINPVSISRCFDAGPPTPILGAHCDRPVGLDSYFASKVARIASCARAGNHGHLALVLDFRFSTSFMRGWGSPTSNIPNPGGVSACVKTAISPLPFGTMHHEHDRYLVVVPIDW